MPPTRLRTAADAPPDVPLERYLNDIHQPPGYGKCGWFGDDNGHRDVEAAESQWRRCRPAVWAMCRVFALPAGACWYDQLTATSIEGFRWAWSVPWFDPEPHRHAVIADLHALDRFIAADAAGAHAIVDHLMEWRRCLEIVADAIEEAARADPAARLTLRLDRRFSSATTYGDAVARVRTSPVLVEDL